jgi:LSD1 subclass zinc finger protein
VRALVEGGHLPADEAGRVSPDDLDTFVRKLEEVEVTETAAAGATDAASTAPRRPATSSRAVPVIPVEDDEDDEDRRDEVIINCPSCSTQLVVPQDAEQFRCPTCSQRGSVVRENPAAAERKPGRRFFGIEFWPLPSRSA